MIFDSSVAFEWTDWRCDQFPKIIFYISPIARQTHVPPVDYWILHRSGTRWNCIGGSVSRLGWGTNIQTMAALYFDHIIQKSFQFLVHRKVRVLFKYFR